MHNQGGAASARTSLSLVLILLSGSAFLLPLADRARAQGPTPIKFPLGARELRLGDSGTDVKTLNWALRGAFLGTPYHGSFTSETEFAVRALQGESGLQANGVVARPTLKVIAARMPRERASWYGPRLYGRRTACGRKLTKRTIGVAHRTLPCGTRVVLAHRGRWVRAKVIDRGPFRTRYRWDATSALAKRLEIRKRGKAKLKVGVVP
jgi:rare lipoprotein A (peptidoglycan hydrolase)